MSIHHVGISGVKDLDAAKAFYEKALGPLGYKTQYSIPGKALGLGPSPYKANFWIAAEAAERAPHGDAVHLAWEGTRAQVHAFHEAALQAGAKCNGQPGFRKQYHPFYYASFVIDPYGNNLEVVNHGSIWQWMWFFIGTTLGFIKTEDTKKAY